MAWASSCARPVWKASTQPRPRREHEDRPRGPSPGHAAHAPQKQWLIEFLPLSPPVREKKACGNNQQRLKGERVAGLRNRHEAEDDRARDNGQEKWPKRLHHEQSRRAEYRDQKPLQVGGGEEEKRDGRENLFGTHHSLLPYQSHLRHARGKELGESIYDPAHKQQLVLLYALDPLLAHLLPGEVFLHVFTPHQPLAICHLLFRRPRMENVQFFLKVDVSGVDVEVAIC